VVCWIDSRIAMNTVDFDAARELRQRLLRRYPAWSHDLNMDSSGEVPILTLRLHHCPEHELAIEVRRSEATVTYNDGLPPGPAERLFIWDDDLGDGLDSVCEFIAEFVRGGIVLVRERLSRLVRFLRRHDCESVLYFARASDIEQLSRRRRRRIYRVWPWDGAARLPI